MEAAALKNYAVTASVNMPYPKQFRYSVSASGYSAAASRAVRKLRAELRGKRIGEIKLDIIQGSHLGLPADDQTPEEDL